MRNYGLEKAIETARKKAIELEAFGPELNKKDKTRRMEKFFYSKHNLEMAYDTQAPEEILACRYRTAAKFGFDSQAYELSQADKTHLRTVDYADALLLSYKARIMRALINEGYNEVLLETTWTPENVLGNHGLACAFIRMTENFLRNLFAVKTLLRAILNQENTADFIRGWISETMRKIDAFEQEVYEYHASVGERINNNMASIA